MKIRYLALGLLALPLALAGCGGARPAAGGKGPSAPPPATLSNPAITAPLAYMARKVRAAPSASAAAALSSRLIRVNDRREIQVYVHVKQLAPATEKALVAAGATEIRPSKPLGLYQAWVTPKALAKIATLDGVTKITPPTYGFPRAGGR
ncbi:MAG: hypothetical protein ACRES9_02615 [Gammaproteobacteria bacterium]